MITLKEAADKIMPPSDSGCEIGSIKDIGDSWIFCIRDKATKEYPDCSPHAVKKDTGEIWLFFKTDHPEVTCFKNIPLSELNAEV